MMIAASQLRQNEEDVVADDDKEKGGSEEKAGGGKKKLIIMIVGALVLVGAAVGGTLMFVGGGESEVAEGEQAAQEDEAPKDIAYLKFTKPLVINYQTDSGKTHFLKAEVTLMTEDEDRLEDIEKHLPRLQHTVNVVFSRQRFEDVRSTEGKENMRLEALKEVQSVLTEEMGAENVDDLLYTAFVTQ